MADFLSNYPSPPSSLPFAPDRDARLAPGVLCLYDPVHSTDPVGAGTASGLIIPNIAEDYLIDLLGSGERGDFDGVFTHGTGNTSSSTKIERTPAGDIHVLMSQTSQTGNQQGAFITLANAVRTYLAANPNNNYFVAMVNTITRAAVGGSGATVDRPPYSMLYTNGASAATANLYGITPNGLYGDRSNSEIVGGLNTVGDQFVALRTASWFGTDPGTLSSLGHPVAWGQSIGSWQTSTYNNRSASFIFRSFIIEDLTVSGRSWSEVLKINKDFWEWDKSESGRRYNDVAPTLPAAFL